MKVEITEKGVNGPDGKRLEVGDEIEVKGDAMPGWLVGKARPLRKAKTAVTNPAKGAVKEDAPEAKG